MTTFHLEVRMTKPSGHYWTIGLNLEAESYIEALRFFNGWSYGVKAASCLTPYLINLSDKATPGRSFFNLDSAEKIFAELTTFMNEDYDDTDMVATNNDDNEIPY